MDDSHTHSILVLVFTVGLIATLGSQGCGPPEDRTPDTTREIAANAVEGSAWGSEKDGLQTRLTCLDSAWAPGQPLRVRLELRNVSDRRVTYDDQQISVNEPFAITGPDGERVRWIGVRAQTGGGPKPIEPGETIVLLSSFDLAERYLLTRPGEYTVRSRKRHGFGSAAIPPSNTVRVLAGNGTPSAPLLLLERIAERLPERWSVSWHRAPSSDDLAILCKYSPPSGLISDGANVILIIGRDKDGLGKLASRRSQGEPEYLGRHALGHVYLLTNPRAKARWSGHRDDLLRALGF